MNLLGTLVLQLTFFLTLVALLFIIFWKKGTAQRDPGIILGLFSCSGVLVASILLMLSLIYGIFSIEYVYHNTESSLPLIYKISAFWSGSAGSLLLWTTCFALVLIFIYIKRRFQTGTKTVFGIILVFMAIFLFMINFINNPFKYVTPQTDGFGLNPALQSLGMIFHPPIILAGFSFFFVAFAYAFHDLRNISQEHKVFIRNWTLWGWVLLTVGIITGGLWAYTELGWGGYWAWDPIENSSLVNWLLATAFLHSLSVNGYKNQGEKRNFILITLTVFSTLIGTFIARSGILKSVHAYSSQSVMIFFGLILFLLAIVTVLIYLKYQQRTKSEEEVSEEVPQNWHHNTLKPDNLVLIILLMMAVLVFGGTILPLFGVQTQTEFYDYIIGYSGLVLLLLFGICPSLFSGKKAHLIAGAIAGIITFLIISNASSYDLLTRLSLAVCTMLIINLFIRIIFNSKHFFSNRKQLSFLIIHVAVIVIALGITGSKGITESVERVLGYNTGIRLNEYAITYEQLNWRYEKGKTVAIATLDVIGKHGRETIKSELAYYQKRDINHSRAVIKVGLWEDLYIIFEGLDQTDRALFRVMVLKWVSLVWIGGLLLTIGTVLRFGSKHTTSEKG